MSQQDATTNVYIKPHHSSPHQRRWRRNGWDLPSTTLAETSHYYPIKGILDKQKPNKFSWFNQSGAGFTLIELLVVIAIIGILSGIGVTTLYARRAQAQNAERIAGAQKIQVAMEKYYQKNGKYPFPAIDNNNDPVVTSTTTYDPEGNYPNDVPWCVKSDGSEVVVDMGWAALREALVPNYIDKLPLDPLMTGPGAGNTKYAGTVFVSGPSDNSQHYLISLPLEPSGANDVLRQNGLITGNVEFSQTHPWPADYMIYTMDRESTLDGTTPPGWSHICGGWGKPTPYFDAMVPCGKSIIPAEKPLPAGTYYTACLGNIRHVSQDNPTADMYSPWTYCDHSFDRDYVGQNLPSGNPQSNDCDGSCRLTGVAPNVVKTCGF